MTTETSEQFKLRETILSMLSDSENESVSKIEGSPRLTKGEEYIDLEQLSVGIQKVSADLPAMGRVLPKEAVMPQTWANIIGLLGRPLSSTHSAPAVATTPTDYPRVIWIDHKQARVFRLRAHESDKAVVTAPEESLHHKHPRGESNAKAHPDDEKRFFREIVLSIAGNGGVLIVGPSTAKLEFFRYVHQHEHTVEKRVVGLETVDHPTDGQIVASARQYFATPKA